MFSKLQKVTVSFIISVRSFVGVEELSSLWNNYHYIWYLKIFKKSASDVQVSLKSDKINSTSREDLHTATVISCW